MDRKERIKRGVEKIADGVHEVDAQIIDFVKEDYRKTLEDIGERKLTVAEATRETLEGVEEGLRVAGHKSKQLMGECADALLDVAKGLGDKSLMAAKKSADEAKASLNVALDKAKGAMDSVDVRTKERMQDAYARLQVIGEAGKDRLEAVGGGIKAYAEQKKVELSDSAQTALHKAADRSRELVAKMSRSTAEYSREALSHSLEKVSDWLGKLSDKVKPG